jgi:2-aminoadipate transaminase
MKASEIREILKLTQKPDIISFAGGLPNPETFPVRIVEEIVCDLLKNNPHSVLQYGTTEGILPLREELAKIANKDGMNIGPENILITHGAQQGIDLLGKIMLDPGDRIIVGAPTYLGATSVFNASEAKMEEVTVDNEGMVPEECSELIKKLVKKGKKVKFVYVMSNFHNPAGVTMPEKRRKAMLDISHEHDVIIVEDDPYGKIRFEGVNLKPIKAFDDGDRVIYMTTFSKLLAPGFRIAWTAAPPEIFHKLVLAKQYTDLCTNAFGQFVTHEYIARGHFAKHIPNIISLYKRKCEIMMKAMDEHIPKDIEYTRPEGGMFSWATCPEGMDSKEILMDAIKVKVAFVTGTSFYATPERGINKMRLNFTHPKDDLIPVGVERLSSVLEQHLKKRK